MVLKDARNPLTAQMQLDPPREDNASWLYRLASSLFMHIPAHRVLRRIANLKRCGNDYVIRLRLVRTKSSGSDGTNTH